MSTAGNGAQKVGEHAVVIGASMAGLLGARALSDAYERVTIIERDELPAVGEGHKSVPQGRHAHVMLASGQRAIEELLPGITEELLAAGAQSAKSLREIRLVIDGHPITRGAHGADVMLASRPLIEGHIRRRVLALANVTARERCDAVDLVTSGDGRRVTGVRVRDHRHFGRDDAALDADLVVAATGRATHIPALLSALGYRRPQEDRLRIDLLYASRRVRLRPGALGGDKLIGIGARPGFPRGLWLIEQEDHWITRAFGYGGEHHPPANEEGYLAFIATIAPADVPAAIRESEPLTEIVTHSFPETSVAAMSASGASRTDCSSSVMRSAASILSTVKACRSQRSKRSRCGAALKSASSRLRGASSARQERLSPPGTWQLEATSPCPRSRATTR